jgi:hypothetical protein
MRRSTTIKRDFKVKPTLGSGEMLDEDEEDEVEVVGVRSSAGKKAKAEKSGREINFWTTTAVVSSQIPSLRVVTPRAPYPVEEEISIRRARAPAGPNEAEETKDVSVEQAALALRVKENTNRAVAAIQASLEVNNLENLKFRMVLVRCFAQGFGEKPTSAVCRSAGRRWPCRRVIRSSSMG